MSPSDLDTTQILSAIDRVNDKLDSIKESLHQVQSEMNTRFSALEAWKSNQEPTISKLEAKVEALDKYRQEADKTFAANQIKDKIMIWAVTTGITVVGSFLIHFALHQATK